ncbi:S-4TM family putative pore-forming effector [Paraflavitalea sp. CAU 1676]|uniref:S-4TM family putative pore-forming effector n=1 Tax=Paraflavitalea sp. CAU 1676 TaxID=3032598 RepID=UPI0023DB2D27|nr:S-4TM family putative pore-forming effector [Paraflavitalea sp. CAU 1676]MDF2192612.1 S-4TM family putative pore-forming effector [Paraflavitalea sp. CAU 1676]
MNNIKELQDKTENLKLLAAQRVLYKRAKKMFTFQVISTVVVSIVFVVLKCFTKEQLGFDPKDINVIAVVVALLEPLLFMLLVSNLRTNGAKIQELFDRRLYGMKWNKANSEDEPEKHVIDENARRYVDDPKAPLENWYDIELDGLSHNKAIITCQETNLFYDGRLRLSFRDASLIVCLIMVLLTVVIAAILDMSMRKYFTYLALPILPAISLTLKIYLENKKSQAAADKLRGFAKQIKRNEDTPSFEDLKQIQDRIYCMRKDSALIPEWYYKKHRARLEREMKVNASAD